MSSRRSTCWRLCAAALVALLSLRAAPAAEFPYLAYVNSTDVYVRSGPGRDYYPTARLNKGETVEVYRHDPGGWLAIRPPQGSFSWVSARHLDIEDDEIAVVNSQRVVARVGSALAQVRDVIQVRLEKDERVRLLEPPSEDSPWCKVAPPAGEFRWVFGKYVDRDLPDDLAEDAREAGLSQRDDAQVRLARGVDEQQRRIVREEMSQDLARLRELERIDIDLSGVVAMDVSQWSFDDLQRRAETALRTAEEPLERGRARVLLDKLERFTEIKRRHDAHRDAPFANGLAGPRSERGQSPRFDASGRLSPVVSRRTGGPQYALVDPSGAVLSFVTPAPGVNLRPFVDRQIGVNGQRAYLPDLERQHISVQRVTLLDTQRR